MKKIVIFLFLIYGVIYAQTDNENLNTQLNKMRDYFLAEDYDSFINYTYPKIIEMAGGKSNMTNAVEVSIAKMKEQGFSIVGIVYGSPSKLLKQENELQYTLRQKLTMQTPQEKVEAEYTLIAISDDKGENWTFIDTSGKSKEKMLKMFPNLSPNIEIKPKTQRIIE